MKAILSLLLWLAPVLAFSQVIDSSVVWQVDSLIQVSRTLTSKSDFGKALEINAAAEKLALEKLGRESAAYGSCCHNRGRVLHIKGDYPESEKWYLEAVSVREKVLGKEHPDYCGSLINLAMLHKGRGKYEESEQLFLEVKEIFEVRLNNRVHPNYLNCLNNLAVLYQAMGKYEASETLYLEAISIREKTLGKEDPDYAAYLNGLASLYHNMGKYEKAEQFYLESKAIREKTLGKGSPLYASSLNNLAILYVEIGKYEKAEPLYLEATAIREKTLKKGHPDYAASLNNLAVLYANTGNYEKAEQLHLEAAAIRKKALGKAHPDYAASLNNLAVLYLKMGRYEKAEPLHHEVISIEEKRSGKEHAGYALGLHNLALLYAKMGNYEKAEPLYLEAMNIRGKKIGKEHPDYASTLNDLAILYRLTGNYEKAEPLCLEAIAIKKQTSGTENPHYCGSLINLANVYKDMGHNEKAEQLFLEAKEIFETHLNNHNHPYYANCLHNLANLYKEMGNYEKAEPLFLKALTIREKVLGKEHPNYAYNLNHLATLYWHLGNYEKAEPFFLEFSKADQKLVANAFHHLSERELSIYLFSFSTSQAKMLSFAQIASLNESVQTGFDNSLFYKGFLLNTSSSISNLAQRDTATTRLHNLLKSYHRRLAAEYAKPIAERKGVAELQEKANVTEKELVRTVAGFGEAIRQVNWQEVQTALKPGEAVIEFIHYNYYTPNLTDSVMYAALVLRPLPAGDLSKAGGDEYPRMIPLFEERQLAPLLRGAQGSDFDLIDQRYTFRNGKNAFHTLIWKPLDSLLRGVNTVYCSPSGLLHRVNLGAIPLNSGQTFADRYRLVLVGSTRNLVVSSGNKSSGNNAALFGGIQYDSKIAAVPIPDLNTDGTRATAATLPFPYDTTLRGGGGNSPWRPLPATETEVRNIAAMLQKRGFKTALQTGPAATEETFKQLGRTEPSPRILHLATHGYFFPDPKSEVRGERMRSEMSEPVFKISDYPMIRAGLILAGANPTWTSGKPPAQGEDGILTAYEISQMNLSNTELVVLSACETGLGDLVGNEGVYGLQRAFKIAGAKYLLMSLWQVSDRMTGELMTEFYRQYLEEKKPVPDAFRGAQRAMRAKYPGSASAWAGFVLVE